LRFSELVSVEHREADDWFNPVLTEDTPLYVDPFLVFDDNDPLFADAQEQVVAFFAMCHDLVRRAGGNTASPTGRRRCGC
jgi:hypothetical protein